MGHVLFGSQSQYISPFENGSADRRMRLIGLRSIFIASCIRLAGGVSSPTIVSNVHFAGVASPFFHFSELQTIIESFYFLEIVYLKAIRSPGPNIGRGRIITLRPPPYPIAHRQGNGRWK